MKLIAEIFSQRNVKYTIFDFFGSALVPKIASQILDTLSFLIFKRE